MQVQKILSYLKSVLQSSLQLVLQPVLKPALQFVQRQHQEIKTSRTTQIKFVAIAMSMLLILGGVYWWHARRYISTDNAYVNANIIQVAAQVSGQVAHLNAQNNQFVKSGTLLFELDSNPFQIAVDKAKAQVGIAVATLENAQASTKRTLMLAQDKTLSLQDRDNAVKNLQVAMASLQLSKASLVQAELDLRNSKIFAATNGYISNMTLRAGNVVSAFQPLFVIISNEQYWVDANFKETELANIKPGQAADIIVDMYPSHVFKGVVENISGGSGTAFSLLPPQNATGNWIKITQRVPVKIRILNLDSQYPLRIGTTATVTVDTYSSLGGSGGGGARNLSGGAYSSGVLSTRNSGAHRDSVSSPYSRS